MRKLTLLLSYILLAQCLLSEDSDEEISWGDDVDGVPLSVMQYWMQRAFQNQIDTQNTPCPAPFGAMVIDHNPDREDPDLNPNGTLICTNSGSAFTFSATQHGEVSALLECAQVLQDKLGSPQGRNYSLWNRYTMYTTGEPCPMCAGAIHWQKLRRIVWSVSIRFLIRNNWPQIHINSRRVHEASETLTLDKPLGEVTYPITIVPRVLFNELKGHFAWQHNPDPPCPPGCHRENFIPPDRIAPFCVKD